MEIAIANHERDGRKSERTEARESDRRIKRGYYRSSQRVSLGREGRGRASGWCGIVWCNVVWCGARLSQPLGYPLAGLTRHDCILGCKHRSLVLYSLYALARSLGLRPSCTRWNSNTVAGSWRGTRELPAVDGFPSRLENTIDPSAASTHHFIALLLYVIPLRFFPPLSIARLSSRLETNGDARRKAQWWKF